MSTVTMASVLNGTSNGLGNPKSTPTTVTHATDLPLSPVSVLDSTKATSQQSLIDAAIEGMKVSGACIVRNLVSLDTLKEIETDVRPHLDAAVSWKGEFYPVQSRRVTGLMGKSKAYAVNIVGNPVWQAISQHFLTSETEWCWVGDKNEHSVSSPQMNHTVVFSIMPGARNQALHRDDHIHYNHHPAATAHHLGRDAGATIFVAASKTTRANGATRFIPGSHLWDYALPPPQDDGNNTQIKYAELSPGDAFIMLSGCYHGSSANTTSDEERLVYSTASIRGWYRQEENQFLANEVERIKELPLDLQRFMGYGLSHPSLGWVNFDDPIKVINGGEELAGTEDMF